MKKHAYSIEYETDSEYYDTTSQFTKVKDDV